MGGRAVLKQVLITMATMFLLNTVAAQVGGMPRSIIKGEMPLMARIKSVFTG